MTNEGMFDEAKQYKKIKRLNVKIKDLEMECKIYHKNNKMFKDHNAELQNTIDRLTTMNKSHKTINGRLRTRLTRLEQEFKDHHTINGKLRSELEIERKNHSLTREGLELEVRLKDKELGRMMKKLQNKRL